MGNRFMSLRLVTKYGSKIGNMIFSPLGERAVKVAGIVPWIHHMRVKRTYHADPKNAQWTAQRDPADPQETKTILKKNE